MINENQFSCRVQAYVEKMTEKKLGDQLGCGHKSADCDKWGGGAKSVKNYQPESQKGWGGGPKNSADQIS